MRKETYLTRSLSNGAVQCQVCEHFCAVRPGQAGRCGVWRNYGGALAKALADAVAKTGALASFAIGQAGEEI
jgi:pyruvate formate lyase activating enzyme